jgi:hypothetical protein
MPPDDLSDLERRLAGWRPDPAGLNADAMLFAAGRASAGRPWLAWSALACSLAALVVAAAAWRLERAERIALAAQLRRQAPAVVVPDEQPTFDEPGPNSFLTAHRALEHGLDAWPPQPVVPPKTPSPEPTVLEAGRRGTLLDP